MCVRVFVLSGGGSGGREEGAPAVLQFKDTTKCSVMNFRIHHQRPVSDTVMAV